MQEKKIQTVELEGNPTTGYSWICTVAPEGIVREVSNEYIPANIGKNMVGSGGKFIFIFEAMAPGEAELNFKYLRAWEKGIPPIESVVYKAIVNKKNSLKLIKK